MIPRRQIGIVLALVFLIRALVPVGFMPGGAGQHLIQICSGTQVKAVLVNDEGTGAGDHSQKAPGQDQDPCPFSFLAAALGQASAPDYMPGIGALVPEELFATSQLSEPQRFPPALYSRAPPSSLMA